MEDLYQIGAIGFIKSIKRFDTSFDVKLSTYAVPYMIGEIKRFLRDDGIVKVSRSIKELGIKIKELQKEYLAKKGIEIKIEEIAKELKVDKEDISLALEATRKVESIESHIQTGKDGKEISLLEKISEDKDEQEMITNKLVISEVLNSLAKRDKEVIMLRFYKEKTQAQVAKILGVSQVQVSRIEKRVLREYERKIDFIKK